LIIRYQCNKLRVEANEDGKLHPVFIQINSCLGLKRQSAILEREAGIEMPRATLIGWINRVGELLRPISAAMGQELLAGDYIQADETPVAVQMHDGRGKNHQA